MSDALIIDAVRTPVGRGRATGALADVHPVDLMAHTIGGLVERTGVPAERIDDVIGGCVTQIGEQSLNITRQAALAAGLPDHVPATTIDRQCGSSQQAVHFAGQGIAAGAYDLVLAAGVESMSRVPMGSAVTADPFGSRFLDRYPDGMIPQGVAAERIAARWAVSRADADALALRSHLRAAAAEDEGAFEREILPVEVTGPDTPVLVHRDEGVRRDTSSEALARLAPSFRSPQWDERFTGLPWLTTAGNSSQISDGAAAVLLASAEAAAAHGLDARARIQTATVAGDDPLMMLTAVIPATRKALDRAGMRITDIDLFEVNEAFAPVVLAWQRELSADLDKVNVHGGAIAIGHPLGASGARILATLLNALERHDATVGLQVICEAGGLANALIVERL